MPRIDSLGLHERSVTPSFGSLGDVAPRVCPFIGKCGTSSGWSHAGHISKEPGKFRLNENCAKSLANCVVSCLRYPKIDGGTN